MKKYIGTICYLYAGIGIALGLTCWGREMVPLAVAVWVMSAIAAFIGYRYKRKNGKKDLDVKK